MWLAIPVCLLFRCVLCNDFLSNLTWSFTLCILKMGKFLGK
ncbi:hypothetical protein ECANGB1_2704 [Enterospora canceri]|uniref:Uncharacterized protein n=1 Tax=Enterospora canceri TaxID=1081671 RepID=A0A1Y1S6K1_9MICR|nr:hypothetical protein ECANGB1_2704 [Enterospora canceri]